MRTAMFCWTTYPERLHSMVTEAITHLNNPTMQPVQSLRWEGYARGPNSQL